jgi:transcription antitermination factor NusG
MRSSLLDRDTPWFALQVKPQHECAVQRGLEIKGFEVYLPIYRGVHRWSDRLKSLDLPLFPGYVFCRFDRSRRTPILATPGVRRVVAFGDSPEPVPDEELEVVRRMLASGLPVEPWDHLKVGQRVRIEYGALAGVEGVLMQMRDTCRVVVSVELLCRSVAVQIDRDRVVPLNRAPGALLTREISSTLARR